MTRFGKDEHSFGIIGNTQTTAHRVTGNGPDQMPGFFTGSLDHGIPHLPGVLMISRRQKGADGPHQLQRPGHGGLIWERLDKVRHRSQERSDLPRIQPEIVTYTLQLDGHAVSKQGQGMFHVAITDEPAV